jgi:xanthine/uracil permease
VQMILGNGLAAGTITAVLLNIAFQHLGARKEPAEAVEPVSSTNVSPA